MKKERNRRIENCVISVLVIFVIFLIWRFIYGLLKYENKWWFNYLDQCDYDYTQIEDLQSEQTEPNSIIEFDLDNGDKKLIYLYDEWYDVFIRYDEKGSVGYCYRVLTSDIFEIGRRKIGVGSSWLKVHFFFLFTDYYDRAEKVLCVRDDGTVEEVECKGYMDTSPNYGGKVGFIYSDWKVRYMVYYPEP